MKATGKRFATLSLLPVLLAALFALSSCAPDPGVTQVPEGEKGSPDRSHYLTAVEDEPDTVDFQCTSIHYTIAQNVFDRLVEMENDGQGGAVILPALAESWEISDDGCRYTFHLRPGVAFSNGSPLTAADVEYTLTRLLTHPDSCNRDIASLILGADALSAGGADRLAGFTALSDLDFEIQLSEPFAAFLPCLSMPGASILDAETTAQAGDRFGKDPAWTVGTGSYILTDWTPGEGMLLAANPACWQGPPKNDGLDLRFLTDAEEVRMTFERGDLDILDLDEVGNAAEYFIHGDIYQDRLYTVQRIGITYVALNESVSPLEDVRVRRALQLALNRGVLLDAVYSGRGQIENGIFPHGLVGYNPDLPEIPYDPDGARALLEEAGMPEGFDLPICVNAASTQWEMGLVRLIASMWGEVGIRAEVTVLEDAEFMRRRKAGELPCYSATWTADFDDPDNFIYTFFGSQENTSFRSLHYGKEDVMARVQAARAISDAEERLGEYQALERIIVQEDAAWVPLFSRLRYYVASEEVDGIRSSWNGSVKNRYRDIYFK